MCFARKKIYRQMYGKLEKLIERVLAKLKFKATFFKRDEYNILLSILTLRFMNCVKLNFAKSYLPSDSHTNTVISDRFAYRQHGFENRGKAYDLCLHVIPLVQWSLAYSVRQIERDECQNFA